MDHASGRDIALLDSDDAWHPDKLQLQVQQLEAAPDGAMLVSLTRQLVTGRRHHIAPSRLMTRRDDVGSYLFQKGGVIQSSMMMLRRDLAVSVRFEDGSRFHDDWSFALRLQTAGARFEMLPQALTIYDDAAGRPRLSPAYTASRLQWLDARRFLIGDAAYWSAVAALASRLPHDDNVTPLRLIFTACRTGAISAPRAAYYSAAWLFPPLRNLARSAVEWWRGPANAWTSGRTRRVEQSDD